VDDERSNIYCYYVYSPANNYGSKPTFYHRDDLPGQGYRSLYAVTEADAKAIAAAGTISGFRGTVWEERLWIDVDSYEEAGRLELTLKQRGLDYEAYDSGGKGAHFGILRSSYPSHLLPTRDRTWSSALGLALDTSIYTSLHLFRLPGSTHERTGRKKELVEKQAGKTLILPPHEKPKIRLSSYTESGDRSVFDCIRVQSNTIPATLGERHAHLVRLTYALRDDAAVDAEKARWWLGEVNKLYEERKTEEELDKIISSIYSEASNQGGKR